MKRITVAMPDHLSAVLEQERRRRDVSVATVVREALEAYLIEDGRPREYSFIGLGRSRYRDTGRNFDMVLAEERNRDRRR